MEYTIDAKNKMLGRVASDAATVLRGKKEPDFTPNRVSDLKLTVLNADKIDISDKKKKQKGYKTFSGYPSGLKIAPMEKVLEKKGIEHVLKKAIMGMLPKNKLRKQMMKNLIISK